MCFPREFVEMTYKPPQIRNVDLIDDIVGRYLCDYRRVYVEHPRLRMDGVYIAVCHYV
jgi:F-box protein 9